MLMNLNEEGCILSSIIKSVNPIADPRIQRCMKCSTIRKIIFIDHKVGRVDCCEQRFGHILHTRHEE